MNQTYRFHQNTAYNERIHSDTCPADMGAGDARSSDKKKTMDKVYKCAYF